jgi:hypothetical protein
MEVRVIATQGVLANGVRVGTLEYANNGRAFYIENGEEDYAGEWSGEVEAKAALEKDMAGKTVSYGYRRN